MPNTTYEDLLRDVFENGVHKGDRTGTGTRSVFGRQIRFNLAEGFPLITTKKVRFDAVAEELIWFLQGDSNIRYLLERDVHIWSEWPFKDYFAKIGCELPVQGSEEWNTELRAFEQSILDDDEFAKEYGDLGPVYGVQWRTWQTATGEVIDQIATVMKQIKENPNSRRMVVSAWNVPELPKMALEPCHALFQFYVAEGKLSCQLYQRSADMFLGVPFNIASYALLTHMVAAVCGLEVGEFVWTGGDTHIYENHFKQVRRQLSREARELPTLDIVRTPESIFDFTIEDFRVNGYDPHPYIKAPVAV